MGPITRIGDALEPYVPCERSLALSGFRAGRELVGDGRSTGACVMPAVACRHVVLLSEMPLRADVDGPCRRVRGA